MYVLSIEQKTYTGKGASSGLSCRKDYSIHGEVYRKKIKKSTTTDIHRQTCYWFHIITNKGVQHVYVISCR